MRVFAGPNGSGKSTIINAVKERKPGGKTIDFGIYVNADDIAENLRKGSFYFSDYEIQAADTEFTQITVQSGLINEEFNLKRFKKSYKLNGSKIFLVDKTGNERLAQIFADFLRKKLLLERKKFSFETVFSHPSKLHIMREAETKGYKVYLYFVSTESPEINKERVQIRKGGGGHDVPSHLIESRYKRSLG